MAPEDKDRLAKVVTEVQRRWGTAALRRLGEAAAFAEAPHILTGFSELDQALGKGGDWSLVLLA